MYYLHVNISQFSQKPPPLKHILALPTLGQECLRSGTELIEKVNFDLGHPVQPTNKSQLKSTLCFRLRELNIT